MMIAVDKNRKYVEESQIYYQKKRKEGKKHNQAIRSLGRHLARIIYKMLKEKRTYNVKEVSATAVPIPGKPNLRLVA